MKLTRWIATGVLVAITAGPLGAQAPAGRGGTPASIKNPRESDPAAIQAGRESYRARCASCHGAEAKGDARGCDLTSLWAAGATDLQLFQTIRRGIPNTVLPHSFGPDAEIWAILAYARTLNADADRSRAAAGDAANGERLFQTHCGSCHQLNGRGGRLGPDLSRVAATRSRPFLAHKIRHASAYIMSVWEGGYLLDGYQPVALVTRDGQRIRGLKKNEDAFSIQIVDANERLQGFRKADLRELVDDTTSLMPDFGRDRLNDSDLDDLLAYLGTLRGRRSG